MHIELGEVPSRCEFERALQHDSCHKPSGPDNVPGEVLHLASGAISRPLYQLVLKLALRRDEPLAFKGGLQLHMWKGKGSSRRHSIAWPVLS